MNTKNNQRYADTERRIHHALNSLLLKKKITVRDICREAQIHHTTFYEHYADIYDLVEKTERQTGNELYEYIKEHTDHLSLSVSFITAIIEFVKKNRDFYTVYLNDYGLSSVDSGFERVWTTLEQSIASGDYDYNAIKYSFEFSKAGALRVISCWLNNGCREPADEISNILFRLIQLLQLQYPHLSESLFK